jgi:hypothetical protein
MRSTFLAIALCLFCAPAFAAPKILPIAPYRTAVSITINGRPVIARYKSLITRTVQ